MSSAPIRREDEKDSRGVDISIIMASNKPSKLKEFLDSAHATCSVPQNVEFVIGVNREDVEMLEFCEGIDETYDFHFTIIPLDNPEGYFGLGYAYDTCFIASNESSYFIQILNDKLRFVCHEWDLKYLSYKKHFEDDVFVVRTSQNRGKSYQSQTLEALNSPENYRIYTRKMYNLLEGHGDYWSADTWHEPTLILLGEMEENRQVVCDRDIFDRISEVVSSKSPENKERTDSKIKTLLDTKYYDLTFKRIAEKILAYINNNQDNSIES
jgi:hypothetical protein